MATQQVGRLPPDAREDDAAGKPAPARVRFRFLPERAVPDEQQDGVAVFLTDLMEYIDQKPVVFNRQERADMADDEPAVKPERVPRRPPLPLVEPEDPGVERVFQDEIVALCNGLFPIQPDARVVRAGDEVIRRMPERELQEVFDEAAKPFPDDVLWLCATVTIRAAGDAEINGRCAAQVPVDDPVFRVLAQKRAPGPDKAENGPGRKTRDPIDAPAEGRDLVLERAPAGCRRRQSRTGARHGLSCGRGSSPSFPHRRGQGGENVENAKGLRHLLTPLRFCPAEVSSSSSMYAPSLAVCRTRGRPFRGPRAPSVFWPLRRAPESAGRRR